MTESWANHGADLHLELAGPHGRAALERALREAVQTGRLHAGTRLPSSRTLARDLGVARNTIVDVYGQLVAEGWLVAVTGSGTRVASPVAISEAVELAKTMSTDDSPRFLNGILDRIAEFATR